MKNNKKIIALIISLSLSTIPHIVCMDERDMSEEEREEHYLNLQEMEPVEPERRTKKNYAKRLASAIKSKLTKKRAEPFSFAALPGDAQQKIINLILSIQNAPNLKTAIKTITRVSRVNKNFHDYINDSNIFFNLLTNLSITFGESSEKIASRLPLQAAQKYLMSALIQNDASTSELRNVLRSPHVNVNVVDQYGNTPLIHALEEGNIEKIDALLKNPLLNINAQNNDGNTALHIVLYHLLNRDSDSDINYYLSFAEKLLERGASTKIINNSGDKPTHITLQINIPELINLIAAARTAANLKFR